MSVNQLESDRHDLQLHLPVVAARCGGVAKYHTDDLHIIHHHTRNEYEHHKYWVFIIIPLAPYIGTIHKNSILLAIYHDLIVVFFTQGNDEKLV